MDQLMAKIVVASDSKSLPKYITDIVWDANQITTYIDRLTIVRSADFNEYGLQYPFDGSVKMQEEFIAFNEALWDTPENQVPGVLTGLGIPGAKQIWDRRYELRDKYEKLIQENVCRADKIKKDRTLLSMHSAVEYTEPRLTKMSMLYEFGNTRPASLQMAFANIRPKDGILMATWNGHIAIDSSITPHSQWLEYPADAPAIWVVYEQANGERNESAVAVEKGMLIMETFVRGAEGDALASRIATWTDKKQKLVVMETTLNISRPFYTFVWAHLIAFDSIIAKVCFIDESNKASRIGQSVYVSFYDSSTAMIKHYKKGLYTIRVKAKTMNGVRKTIDTLARVTSIYQNKYDSVIKYYMQYIPDLLNHDEKEIHRQTHLRALVPDVFPVLYSRKCNKKPTLFEDESQVPEGFLKFKPYPVKPFPVNGQMIDPDPKIYACMDPEYPWPGMANNHTWKGLVEDRHGPEALPCCYQNKGTQPTVRMDRYYGLTNTKTPAISKQRELFLTNKVLPAGSFGSIKPAAQNFLKRYFNGEFLRTGVLSGNQLNQTVTWIDESPNMAVALALNVPVKNITPDMMNASKQELSTVKINWFDPSVYISTLEAVYDCTIFLFDDTEPTKQVLKKKKVKPPKNKGIVLPRCRGPYIKRPHKNKTVMLYAHRGSERDNLTNPICEPLIYNRTGMVFSKTSTRDLYNDFLDAIGQTNPAFDTSNLNIIRQKINSQGKAIAFEITGSDGKQTWQNLPNPTCPEPVPIVDEPQDLPIDPWWYFESTERAKKFYDAIQTPYVASIKPLGVSYPYILRVNNTGVLVHEYDTIQKAAAALVWYRDKKYWSANPPPTDEAVKIFIWADDYEPPQWSDGTAGIVYAFNFDETVRFAAAFATGTVKLWQ